MWQDGAEKQYGVEIQLLAKAFLFLFREGSKITHWDSFQSGTGEHPLPDNDKCREFQGW